MADRLTLSRSYLSFYLYDITYLVPTYFQLMAAIFLVFTIYSTACTIEYDESALLYGVYFDGSHKTLAQLQNYTFGDFISSFKMKQNNYAKKKQRF